MTDVEKRDNRIRAHAKSLAKNGSCCRKHWVSMNFHVWMPLARRWQMPIQEIKKIVRPNAVQQPAEVV